MGPRGTILAGSLAAGLALAPASGGAAGDAPSAAASAPNPYLASGVRLYEALEFTAALENLRKAEKYSSGPAEDVLIHTYEGIIQASLGTADQAEPDFRVALSLDPHAQLPENTSPKIRAVWEQVRREMVGKPLLPAPSAPPPNLVPGAPPPTTSRSATPAGGLSARLIPAIAAGGGGLLLTGVGLVLGLVANSTGKQASSDGFQSDAANDLHSADQQQVAGNILIGVGVAALVGAGALYLIASSSKPEPSEATPASHPALAP